MPSLARALVVLILLASGFVGYSYLTRPDQATVEVAQWVKANTNNDDIILYQPRHAAVVMDYQHQPLLSHLTGRGTWIWTRTTPSWEKEHALQTAAYVVVTNPSRQPVFLEVVRQRFKGLPAAMPESVSSLYPDIIDKVYEDDYSSIYEMGRTEP